MSPSGSPARPLPFARGTVLIVGLVAAVLLGIAIAGVFYVRTQEAREKNRIARELTSITELKIKQITAWREERLGDARMVMRLPFAARAMLALASNPADRTAKSDIQAWLTELIRAYDYDGIMLFDRDLHLVASTPAGPEAMEPALQELLLAVPSARDVLMSDFHRSPDGRIHLELLAPIFDGTNSRPIGAMLLRIDPQKFLYPLLADWPVPNESGETLLLRRDGEDIVYLNELRYQTGTAAQLRRSIREPALVGARIARGEPGEIQEGVDYRGVPVLGVGRAVPGTPWFIVAKIDRDEIYAPLQRETTRVAVTTAAIFCSAVFGAGLIWRHRRAEIVQRSFDAERTRESLARRLALVMQRANDSIFMLDEAGCVLEANDRAFATYGYTLEELRALPPGGVRAPATAGAFAEQFKQFDAPGGTVFETVHQRKDGTTFSVETSGSVSEFDGRRLRLCVVRDISQRKTQAEQIERLSRLYAALSEVNQAIVHSPSREKLLPAICQALVASGRFKMAWIGWHNPINDLIEPVAAFGDEAGYLRGISVYASDRPEGRGPSGTALRENRVSVCNDYASDPRTLPWRERAAEHGIRASISLPVRAGNTPIAVLSVYASTSFFFGDKEIALLEEAAGEISFALDNLERDAQREHAEAALRASESRYRAMFENSLDGFLLTVSDGGILSANSSACRIFGRTEKELVGGGLGLVAAPDDPRLGTLLEQRARTGRAAGELTLVRSDGSRFEAEIASVMFDTDDGARTSMVIRDITERRRTEQHIRQQAELIDKADEAIVASDLDGRITFWSQGAERLFGWKSAETIGQPMNDVLALRSVVGDTPPLPTRLPTSGVWRGEVRSQNRAGGALMIETSITILRDNAGQPTGRLSISTDITEKKKLEERFLHAQRLENLGMLASGVAHDLNNVLAPIVFAAPMLRPSLTGERDLKILTTLERSAERGAGLVKQILGFARSTTGELRPTQVKHLARDIIGVIEETFPKSVQFEHHIPSDLWPVIGNPTQIHQILLNLCVNARDAMPAGGTLRLTAMNRRLDAAQAAAWPDARPGAWLVLEVADTGGGIAPEVLARIWEPFFTTKAAGKGTGLGLSTVRGIVATHRGFVTLETKVERGTTFSVYLPASLDEATASKAPSLEAPAGRGEYILVVDDDLAIRETVSAVLTKKNYHVACAGNGVEAIDYFTKHSNEIVLLITDMDMPLIGGAALARTLLQMQPALRIVAISGLPQALHNSPDIQTTRKLAHAFLQKPFTAETLVVTVHELLRVPPPN